MKFKNFCFILTTFILAISLYGCALLGFTPEESNDVSIQSTVSTETSISVNVGEDLKWPKDNVLAKLIPEFSAGRTIEILENDQYVRFKITDVTKKDFSDYVSKLIKEGFDDVVYTADELFSAKSSTEKGCGVVIYLVDTTITLEIAKDIEPQVSTESIPDESTDDTSLSDESNFDESSEKDSSIDDSLDEETPNDESVIEEEEEEEENE